MNGHQYDQLVGLILFISIALAIIIWLAIRIRNYKKHPIIEGNNINIKSQIKENEVRKVIKLEDIDFVPEEYLFTTDFTSDSETISLSCHKCKNENEISNPSTDIIDKNLNLIDIPIYREKGIGYWIAAIIALIPGGIIYNIIGNFVVGLILWAIITIPLFYVVLSSTLNLFDLLCQVGYINCDSCKEKQFIAFNKNKTFLLEKREYEEKTTKYDTSKLDTPIDRLSLEEWIDVKNSLADKKPRDSIDEYKNVYKKHFGKDYREIVFESKKDVVETIIKHIDESIKK